MWFVVCGLWSVVCGLWSEDRGQRPKARVPAVACHSNVYTKVHRARGEGARRGKAERRGRRPGSLAVAMDFYFRSESMAGPARVL